LDDSCAFGAFFSDWRVFSAFRILLPRYAIAGGQHVNDVAMVLMITSSLSKSTLLQSTKIYDFASRLA
jgi:hypothetical protein